MEWNSGITWTVGGSSLTFDAPTGDAFYLDPTQCSGLDAAPVRAPIDNLAATDGGIIHPFFKAPRHITLSGQLIVRTGTDDASAIAARNALEFDLLSLCDLNLNADGTLAWTPGGYDELSITVRCEIPVVFSGGLQKSYVIGLVAADPTILGLP